MAIERSERPRFLCRADAVKWIRTNRPVPWIGSIFSVPPPSEIPACASVTKALLAQVFPAHEIQKQTSLQGESASQFRKFIIENAQRLFSLEQLLDHVETLCHPKYRDTFLNHFRALDVSAEPNSLHYAIVKSCDKGLSQANQYVTINWDTLLERAFRNRAHTCPLVTPKRRGSPEKSRSSEKALSILHPHGSFETNDPVSSAF